ncbi:unnamed protein product [marine sediment metagenome]|jgi:hypothetical protein|uniref:Uncharacterized protein n=1 Tax=marine sediment metagenome TaxID=412755 RepID=X1GU36_9ZZZZ
MADNDSSIIKPMEGLQNIEGLTPTRRREERKRKQSLNKQNKEEPEEELNESVDQQDLGNELTENESDQNTIDYCA